MQVIVRNTLSTNKYISDMLIGRELHLTPTEVNKLNSGSTVVIDGIPLNKSCLEYQTVDKQIMDNVYEEMAAKWHRVEDPYLALSEAFELGYNVMFYGAGGYGKVCR